MSDESMGFGSFADSFKEEPERPKEAPKVAPAPAVKASAPVPPKTLAQKAAALNAGTEPLAAVAANNNPLVPIPQAPVPPNPVTETSMGGNSLAMGAGAAGLGLLGYLLAKSRSGKLSPLEQEQLRSLQLENQAKELELQRKINPPTVSEVAQQAAVAPETTGPTPEQIRAQQKHELELKQMQEKHELQMQIQKQKMELDAQKAAQQAAAKQVTAAPNAPAAPPSAPAAPVAPPTTAADLQAKAAEAKQAISQQAGVPEAPPMASAVPPEAATMQSADSFTQNPETPKPGYGAGREGYSVPVEIDANKFKQNYETSTGEPLVWKEAKAEAIRSGKKSIGNPEVGISEGGADAGKWAVNDGRHRISVAAEQGKKITVWTSPEQAAKLQEQFGVSSESPKAPVAPVAPPAQEKRAVPTAALPPESELKPTYTKTKKAPMGPGAYNWIAGQEGSVKAPQVWRDIVGEGNLSYKDFTESKKPIYEAYQGSYGEPDPFKSPTLPGRNRAPAYIPKNIQGSATPEGLSTLANAAIKGLFGLDVARQVKQGIEEKDTPKIVNALGSLSLFNPLTAILAGGLITPPEDEEKIKKMIYKEKVGGGRGTQGVPPP